MGGAVMAGSANGRSPFPGLFVAYPPARRNWRAMAAVGLPDPPEVSPDEQPGADAADSDDLFGPPIEIPGDLDDRVRAYAVTGEAPPGLIRSQPSAAPPQAGVAEADPFTTLPPELASRDGLPGPKYARRELPSGAVGGIGASLNDQVNAIPDSLTAEYGSVIYRDKTGKIGATPLSRQQSEKGMLGDNAVPDGATILAMHHNHPYVSGLDLGRAAYKDDTGAIENYLRRIVPTPSRDDMSWEDKMRNKGATIDPGFVHLITGPDGRLRAY
jgi:hypothetical protein